MKNLFDSAGQGGSNSFEDKVSQISKKFKADPEAVITAFKNKGFDEQNFPDVTEPLPDELVQILDDAGISLPPDTPESQIVEALDGNEGKKVNKGRRAAIFGIGLLIGGAIADTLGDGKLNAFGLLGEKEKMGQIDPNKPATAGFGGSVQNSEQVKQLTATPEQMRKAFVDLMTETRNVFRYIKTLDQTVENNYQGERSRTWVLNQVKRYMDRLEKVNEEVKKAFEGNEDKFNEYKDEFIKAMKDQGVDTDKELYNYNEAKKVWDEFKKKAETAPLTDAQGNKIEGTGKEVDNSTGSVDTPDDSGDVAVIPKESPEKTMTLEEAKVLEKQNKEELAQAAHDAVDAYVEAVGLYVAGKITEKDLFDIEDVVNATKKHMTLPSKLRSLRRAQTQYDGVVDSKLSTSSEISPEVEAIKAKTAKVKERIKKLQEEINFYKKQIESNSNGSMTQK